MIVYVRATRTTNDTLLYIKTRFLAYFDGDWLFCHLRLEATTNDECDLWP